ncbi:MAG: HAMP domain-containing sensor histidine kinase [Aeromicrobium sp.]|uniref:sensor histidine kinase n=1 Tax=Aeromicrobium sp. TaxID=1871063 RepID=UPI0026042AF6|nr:HAMP domain-containing sensor histidine kinase [Aeromicrobium sp.]MDF1705990.1 HAMP domain-containing sensor histidine kinase [Aeromicrobium sp.]
MRERLVGILVALIVGVVVLYAVPRAYVTADLVRDHEAAMIERTADFLEARIDSRIQSGSPIDVSMLRAGLDGTDGARYVALDGTTVEAGQYDDDPDASFVETRRTDGQGVLTVTRDRSVVTAEVERALVPLIVLGVLLAAVACAIGYVVIGRMSRPFDRLAVAAEELGRGTFDLDLPRGGVPEAQAISEALRTSATRLDELVRRERELAVTASHQLRTPITALRLELEDLTYWPETSPEVAAQVRRSIDELDRLTASIDDLLDLARRLRHDGQIELDLTAFVADTVERWRRRAAARGRTVVVTAPGPVRATIATEPVAQVLDVLIENACQHGTGTITVSAREAGSNVEVRVGDEGARTFGSEVFGRGDSTDARAPSRLGLPAAAELATGTGGHLSLDETTATTCFVLLLPGGR